VVLRRCHAGPLSCQFPLDLVGARKLVGVDVVVKATAGNRSNRSRFPSKGRHHRNGVPVGIPLDRYLRRLTRSSRLSGR
jgi:hypothetical protein